MFRRIPHASNGSFNLYIITNKEAHMVNGNPAGSKESNGHKTSPNKPQFQKYFTKELSEPLCSSNLPAVQMHFKNYCLDVPGKFSCAIDCFMELRCYILKNAIPYVERNKVFEMLYIACVHTKKSIYPLCNVPKSTKHRTSFPHVPSKGNYFTSLALAERYI